MLDPSEIDRIASQAARTALTGVELVGVHGEPTTDWVGDDALLITIVMRTGMETAVTGDAALQTIVRIKRDLSSAGEDRFPHVKFTTEGEMLMDIDDDS